jgi:hypothetical protein
MRYLGLLLGLTMLDCQRKSNIQNRLKERAVVIFMMIKTGGNITHIIITCHSIHWPLYHWAGVEVTQSGFLIIFTTLSLGFFTQVSLKKKIISHSQKKHSPWMTKGLKISINHKRDLYLRCKYSNDQKLKKLLQNILQNFI